MSEEEYKVSPWFTAKVGDRLVWGGTHRIVLTKAEDGVFSYNITSEWMERPGINNIKWSTILPGWKYDEVTEVKKILEEYSV
jgi:hypothetical protein